MTARPMDNDQMPAPLGPYSQAVSASGQLVFISGQPGIDPGTGEAPLEFKRQAMQAFENLLAVVRAAGLSKSDLVKTTVYLTKVENFAALNDVFEDVFPNSPPARAAPIVRLPRGLLISVEAVAVRSPSPI